MMYHIAVSALDALIYHPGACALWLITTMAVGLFSAWCADFI